MKKFALGTMVALAILFAGCGENETEKQGKIQFVRDVQLWGSGKAVNMAEASFGKEKVEEWIKELKEKGQWKEETTGKSIDYSDLSK